MKSDRETADERDRQREKKRIVTVETALFNKFSGLDSECIAALQTKS